MRPALVVVLLVGACGGVVTQTDGGADSDSASSDAIDDVSYGQCAASNGLKLCGLQCGQNACGLPCNPDRLAACYDLHSEFADTDCIRCRDGWLCLPPQVEVDGGLPGNPSPADAFYPSYFPGDPGYAVMFALNGFGSLCRYADRSTYDGTPVPDLPSTCPSTSGFQLCGGSCGDCPSGYDCVGRSPLHPYSICVTSYVGKNNPPGPTCTRNAPNGGTCNGNAQNPPSACLTFKVSDADQPVADQNGICTEQAICVAAAQAYPGGAFCTP